MTDPIDRKANVDTLRAKAEKILREADRVDVELPQGDELLHELNVYQAELEIQNYELREAQLSLEGSRRRYFELFDMAPVGYVVIDSEGVILEANLACAAMICVDKRQLVGRPFTLYVAASDHVKFLKHRQHALESEQRQTGEFFLRTKTGERLVARVESVVCWADQSSRPSLLSAIVDITDRKRTEEALRGSEERYRSLFENMRDAIIVFQRNSGQIINVNRAACLLAAMEHRDLLALTWSNLVSPESGAHNIAAMIDHFEKDPALPLELILRRRDGTGVPVEVSAATFGIGQDTIVHTLLRDITAAKRAAEEKAKLEEQWQQSQKLEAIGRLAGGVAHDMNNLLSIIINIVTALAEEESLGVNRREDVEAILSASRRGRELTQSLLGFARKGNVVKRVMSLNHSATEVANLASRVATNKVSFVLELCPDLPLVEADPGQINQALMNVCLNAVDAMPHGGIAKIKTSVAELQATELSAYPDLEPGRYACITVIDTGEGMTAETRARVFEPFFTTKPPGRGTGLGLSMVYGAIRGASGIVHIDSKPGEGSAVAMYLPVSGQRVIAEPTTPLQQGRITLQGKTFLVIDDEPLVLRAAKRLLQNLGCDVILAKDGDEAIALYQARYSTIAVVMVDVNMPGIDGFEVTRRLRNINPAARVIICSGLSDERMEPELIAEKGIRFLRKPYEIHELWGRIDELFADDTGCI